MKKLITLVVSLALLLGVVPMTDLENGVLAPAAWAEEAGGEGVASPVTAPTTEPAPAPTPASNYVSTAKAKYATNVNGTAVFRATQQKNMHKITVPKTVTTGGVTYRVTTIGAKAFQGSKANLIKLCGNVKSISKDAFTGSKVPKGRIIVKIKKSAYTKKQLKSLKKQLKQAGIKANNIKFY
ncbi:MAG: hypothetical protein IKN04_02865 [Clostridia bacterium]|nr:hypothetical protein [Clostridia bacterium]